MNKKIFSLLLIIPLLAWAMPALAETLQLKCDYATGCDLCDAVALISQISRFILSIAGSLTLLIFVIGGFFLLISQGNSQAVNQGKKMIVGAVLGLIIVFAGWGIVNFVIAGLTGQMNTDVQVAKLFTKPWNELECVKPPKPKPPGTAGGEEETTTAGGNCGGLTTSGIQSSQCSDASPALTELLQCINNHWQEYGIWQAPVITSICDDAGCERCRTNWSQPPCAHSKNSCHYRPDGSYAADFRLTKGTNGQYDSIQGSAFESLVENECGGQFLFEGNHFHVSSPECGGY